MKSYRGKKPLFQKWDEAGFHYDTRQLSWDAECCYRKLLQSAFHISTRPYLPSEDEQIIRIIGCPPEVWQRAASEVRPFFEETEVNGEKLLKQKRLAEDWAELETLRVKRAAAAQSKWEHNGENAVTPDVVKVQSAVYERCKKVPDAKDVKRLLAKYSESRIIEAFNTYYDGLDERDEIMAEYTFFSASQNGGEIVCAVLEKRTNATAA